MFATYDRRLSHNRGFTATDDPTELANIPRSVSEFSQLLVAKARAASSTTNGVRLSPVPWGSLLQSSKVDRIDLIGRYPPDSPRACPTGVGADR